MEFKVSVERTAYVTGYVLAEAETPEQAEKKVTSMIEARTLNPDSPEITWNSEPSFDEGGLRTTGDVD